MKVDKKALEIIDLHGRADGNLFYIEQTLPRKEYMLVNGVLESLGGKWSRKDKCHVFPSGFSVDDALADVLATGNVLNVQKDLDHYETPEDTAIFMVHLAGVRQGHTCLEPSAGKGRIASVLAKACGVGAVTVIDIHPPFVSNLKEVGFENALIVDFLKWDSTDKYDRIVMNPPFSKQADIDHVLQAVGYLAPGGVLVSVMAAGVEFRENRKTVGFKQSLSNIGEFEFIPLPSKTFAESGTNVSTVLLKFTKNT